MTVQIENPYGIKFVDEAPPEPMRRDRDDERWNMVKLILSQAPDKWAAVKEYDKKGSAPQKASQINGDKFKTLPATEYEARATTTEDSSTLFLRLRPENEQTKLKAEAAKSEAAVKAAQEHSDENKPAEANVAPTATDAKNEQAAKQQDVKPKAAAAK